MTTAAMLITYRGMPWLPYAVASVRPHVDFVVVAQGTVPWCHGEGKVWPDDGTRDWLMSASISGVVDGWIHGPWSTEQTQRQAALEAAMTAGCDWAIVMDDDEIWTPELFCVVQEIMEHGANGVPHIGGVFTSMTTYWKSPAWKIDPPEPHAPLVATRVHRRVKFSDIRAIVPSPGAAIGLGEERLHHLSYAGSDERIRRKLATFSHAHELVPDWYENVWKRWTPEMENLHPTHPHCYKRAVPVDADDLPPALKTAPIADDEHGTPKGGKDP